MPTDDHEADQRIAAKIAEGDFDAEVEAWVRRLIRKAMTLARFWNHSHEDAEDYTQAFLLALVDNRLKTYSPTGSLDAYGFRMFVNIFHRQGRKTAERLRRSAPISDETTGDGDRNTAVLRVEGPSIEDTLVVKDLVERALATLSQDDCDIIIASDVWGLSPGEIASKLDIADGTARTRLSRARARLRKAITDIDPSFLNTDKRPNEGSGEHVSTY
jgi:RNA polymerase sigma factor (sigma-70 family)